MKTLLVFLLLVPFFVGAQQKADIVFVNGTVWTVNSSNPRAEAVAVLGDRILSVGSNAEIRALAGPATKVIDLKGRLVLPGFIDNHTHFSSGGFQLQSVDLRYTKTEGEFAQVIGKRAAKFPDRWITGGDWDHDNWPGGKLPTRELVDKVTPKTPVFVNRYDGHMALANSYVLKLAGVTKDTPDPPGGTVVKDPVTGEPTGVLKDEAMSLVYRIMPDPTTEELEDAIRMGLAEARRCGVTSIQDISSSADVRAYQTLRDKGELTSRFYCRLPLSQLEHLAKAGIRAPFGDEFVRVGSLKAYADGSLGSTTALFFDPYVSDPTTRGLATDILQDGSLEQWAVGADESHLQLSIHAIGDSAISRILDIFEKAINQNPSWDRRFRIEHAQHLRPQDFKRFAKLGVIASVQPYHAIDDGRWAEKRIGQERCKTTYAFRSFLDNKVKMCFGSDWTVGPLNPLLGIYAAVTRRTTDGANPKGWFPEQKISVVEAIEAYTLSNAYAAYEEKEKGSIEPGKLADLVVLKDNILTIDPVKIENTRVDMTVLGGRIIFQEEKQK